ncbi:DUF333 domain-containing protein [Pseudoruegeria sp. SHC-113]|uniref:putative hemolysin n=1 Tax=Pseudoruegeria sp. SHC-113 TaxID=2855439 RepID=UPI0021BACDDC|nr:DUF333 domain-containing protein [Pseudoruegeria sp. SHC-113]MCT8159887.1 DUF333 domain-containing protein [Pseudoruegeria sp. SHC-113]
MTLPLAALAALAACNDSTRDVDQVDLANPAAVFCVESNGVYEIREDPEGNQYGVCITEEGEFDAWELYRKSQGESA